MHLSYCTNVHPAEDLDGVLEQLDAFAGPVRMGAGLDRLGVGLWLPAELAARLAGSADDRHLLRDRLDANGLTLRTINAFPYRAFHADVVKLDVYRPDWTDPRRTQYTLDCAAVLADLLPDALSLPLLTLIAVASIWLSLRFALPLADRMSLGKTGRRLRLFEQDVA